MKGADRASALEDEFFGFLVHKQVELFGQKWVGVELWVLVDDLLGDLAGCSYERLVPPQRRQAQVAPPLLPDPKDGALAAQLEVDLCQLEAVARSLEGAKAPFRPWGDGLSQQVAPGRVATAADSSPQLVQLGDAKAVGVFDHDHRRVRDVDAHLDDRRRRRAR